MVISSAARDPVAAGSQRPLLVRERAQVQAVLRPSERRSETGNAVMAAAEEARAASPAVAGGASKGCEPFPIAEQTSSKAVTRLDAG